MYNTYSSDRSASDYTPSGTSAASPNTIVYPSIDLAPVALLISAGLVSIAEFLFKQADKLLPSHTVGGQEIPPRQPKQVADGNEAMEGGEEAPKLDETIDPKAWLPEFRRKVWEVITSVPPRSMDVGDYGALDKGESFVCGRAQDRAVRAI